MSPQGDMYLQRLLLGCCVLPSLLLSPNSLYLYWRPQALSEAPPQSWVRRFLSLLAPCSWRCLLKPSAPLGRWSSHSQKAEKETSFQVEPARQELLCQHPPHADFKVVQLGSHGGPRDNTRTSFPQRGPLMVERAPFWNMEFLIPRAPLSSSGWVTSGSQLILGRSQHPHLWSQKWSIVNMIFRAQDSSYKPTYACDTLSKWGNQLLISSAVPFPPVSLEMPDLRLVRMTGDNHRALCSPAQSLLWGLVSIFLSVIRKS